MFRNNKADRTFHVNFLFNDGGLGDCLARLPAIEYVIQNHPEVIPHVWIPDFFYDIAKRSLTPGRVVLKKFSQKDKFNKLFPTRASASNTHTNLSYHMTEHGFNLFINKQVEDKHKNYLPIKLDDVNITKFNLPDKYVVITTGFTSTVREFLPTTINSIIDYVLFKGYTPVFLGKKETDNGFNYIIKGKFDTTINYHKGINLIDQTNLLETAKILYGAKTTVGLDNGLIHLAATHPTNTVVCGFTTVDPQHRVPFRNNGVKGYNFIPVIPPDSVECRFCQSNFVFAFHHESFTKCYYDKNATGAEIECLKSLTPDLFILELDKIL